MARTAMITELTLEGFKSFGTPAQTLQLGALNFVVGANASGKTNLISALRFLRSSVLQDAEFAVDEFGGLAEVRNKIQRQSVQQKPLMIAFKMEVDAFEVRIEGQKRYRIRSYDYVVKLDLRSSSGRPEVESETLTASIQSEEGDELRYSLKRDRQNVIIKDPVGQRGHSKVKEQRFSVPDQETARLALGVGFFSFPCVVLRTIVDGWRFYNISPHLARLPCKETPDADLGLSGENLAVILHKLEQQNGKGALDSVVTGLRGAVPGFRNVKTARLPVEGKWAFQILEEKIRGAINPDSASDGTIRLLSLLVIANWRTEFSSLVAIEEPENGVHPHLSEHIMQILRAAAEDRQLIVTTHNPAFLDYLEPQEVILCDKQDGFTKLRRASDVAQIETFRKHFRLGELWEQGTLGGIP